MPHDHSHHHHGGSCQHDDDEHIKPEEGEQDSLFPYIDKDNIVALNESVPDSGKLVVKPWHERQDLTHYLESEDDDEQLLLRIPFTANVKLRSISLLGEGGAQAPKQLKIYINKPELDFSDVLDDANQPVQTLDLVQSRDVVEYPVRPAKFNNIQHLSLFFSHNFADEAESPTRIYYVGFKGESSGKIVNSVKGIVYEAQANPADHAKIAQKTGAGARLGF